MQLENNSITYSRKCFFIHRYENYIVWIKWAGTYDGDFVVFIGGNTAITKIPYSYFVDNFVTYQYSLDDFTKNSIIKEAGEDQEVDFFFQGFKITKLICYYGKKSRGKGKKKKISYIVQHDDGFIDQKFSCIRLAALYCFSSLIRQPSTDFSPLFA